MGELLSDELWGVIEPHLPERKRRAGRKGGRPPIPDRRALTGILFVLRHGLPWGELPSWAAAPASVAGGGWWPGRRRGMWARVWRALRDRGICPRIARRGVESSQRLGRHRWGERTLAWLHSFRRLRVPYERCHDVHLPFLSLGCILTCARFLHHQF